jgi:hypothetical protein
VDGPDGSVVRHEYYPGDLAVAPGPFGDGTLPADDDVDVGYGGMLARIRVRTHRPGHPEGGPPDPPAEVLSGPYQWMLGAAAPPPGSPRAAIETALADLGLPPEIVADVLATLTIQGVEPEQA